MEQQNLCNLKTQEETKMNKLITTIAAIAMLAVSGSAFAQLVDGEKINVAGITQQMKSSGLAYVPIINVDTNGLGVQDIGAVRDFDVNGGAPTMPGLLNNRQHFLVEALAGEDGNERWNQIRFQDYDRANAIYTREFTVKTDCTIDFRIDASSPVIEEKLPFMRNDYTILAADSSIFLWVTIDDPRCSGVGADGAAGADGADGAAGAEGAAGAAGADGTDGADGADGAAPCVDCSTLSDAVVDFTCKMMAGNPPSSVSEFDDYVDAVVDTLTLTTNVCTDKAQCIIDIKAAITALK
jgi:hypothetical protein